MSKIPITFRGREFASLKELARAHGQHYGNLVRRINVGWSIEEALGLVERPLKRPERGNTLITSAGEFPSITDAAEHFGISYSVVYARLEEGWTPDEAVGLEPHTRRKKRTTPVECRGKTYPNRWALAQAYNMPEKLVAKRIRAGWTPEQAVGLVDPPPRYRDRHGNARATVWKDVEIVGDSFYPATDTGEYKLYLIINQINGKEYVGITISPLSERFRGHRAAARHGLKSKLYNAMRRYGIKNFSINLLRDDARSYSELQQQEMAEIAKRDAIKHGYNVSPGGAVGTPESIKVGDQVFPSRSAAAEHFGIDVSVFNLRISRLGWMPEQAAEIEPREKYARHKLQVGENNYPSLMQAAQAHGLDYQLVWSRFVDKGWTLEQALEVAPPPDTIKSRGIPVTAFGKQYPSIEACAKAHGIKGGSLQMRLTRHREPVEDAVRHLLKYQASGKRQRKFTDD